MATDPQTTVVVFNETKALYELYSDALKIGLGALISGSITYLLTIKNHKNELKKIEKSNSNELKKIEQSNLNELKKIEQSNLNELQKNERNNLNEIEKSKLIIKIRMIEEISENADIYFNSVKGITNFWYEKGFKKEYYEKDFTENHKKTFSTLYDTYSKSLPNYLQIRNRLNLLGAKETDAILVNFYNHFIYIFNDIRSNRNPLPSEEIYNKIREEESQKKNDFYNSLSELFNNIK